MWCYFDIAIKSVCSWVISPFLIFAVLVCDFVLKRRFKLLFLKLYLLFFSSLFPFGGGAVFLSLVSTWDILRVSNLKCLGFSVTEIRRGVLNLKSGSHDPDHAPLMAIYLSFASTCHDPTVYRLWTMYLACSKLDHFGWRTFRRKDTRVWRRKTIYRSAGCNRVGYCQNILIGVQPLQFVM